MAPIQTYVFLDTETTGLPTRKDGVPGVTELGMLAINRKHFLERKENEEIRVQHKLLVCFNPCKEMSEKSVKLSGLNNQLLEQEGHFNMNFFHTINSFINCLQKPVCLIAHNGLGFHFPILKYYFINMDIQCSPEIKCTDSLYGFYDLLEAEKLGNMSNMNNTSQEKSYLQLYRTLFYEPNAVPVDSYVLNQIYGRVVGGDLETNRAENHCVMILKIASGRAERFVQWVDANHCPFSEVRNEPVL